MQDDTALAAALRMADGTTPSVDRFESCSRRHRLVDSLESSAGVATVDELIDELAADDAEPLDPESLRVRLVHVALPRLEDAGRIAYDPASDSVRLVGDGLVHP